MKGFSRSIASALGLTAIAMLWVCGPLIEPHHYALLHWSTDAWRLFVPVLLDFLLCWAILALLLRSAERPGVWRRTAWLAVLIFLPWITLKSWELYSAAALPIMLPRLLLITCSTVFVVLALSWRSRWTAGLERLIDISHTVLSFLAITGVILFVQVLLVFWTARHLNTPQPAKPLRSLPAAGTPPRARVIWILLDELPESQIFDHRPEGVALPALDAMAAQSTVFTEVQPVEQFTERVMPALLVGQRSDNTRSAANGDVFLHHPNGNWFPFDARQSIFADAQAAGYQTAVAGWHNPYCRMLGDTADRCFWTFRPRLTNGMSSGESFAANMVAPLQQLGGYGIAEGAISAVIGLPRIQIVDAQLHIDDVRSLAAVSDTLLSDPRLNFLLLHLPAPHPTGIYNRRRHQFVTSGGSFIDNLVLADDLLAHIRSVLQAQGEWDSDAIVVSGDHGWRVNMWRHLPGWTTEGERASHGGHVDLRPAMMVKLPQQNTSQQETTPVSLLSVHDLLDDLLHGTLQKPEDVLRFAQQHATSPLPARAAH